MKKSLIYLCTGILVLGLTACGGSPEESGEQSTGSSVGTEGSAGDEGSVGTGETEGSDESGTESSDPGEGSAGDDQQEAGDGQGEEPAGGWSEEMAGLRAAVAAAVGEENYWPDTAMDTEMFQAMYQVTSDLYDDYMAESPMVGTNVDTLIIVKAKEGQVDAVYDILNTYREGLVNDTMQYPMNLGKIQASRLEKIGNYVIFAQLGGATPDEEEAAITQCQEANDKAIEAIRGIVEG